MKRSIFAWSSSVCVSTFFLSGSLNLPTTFYMVEMLAFVLIKVMVLTIFWSSDQLTLVLNKPSLHSLVLFVIEGMSRQNCDNFSPICVKIQMFKSHHLSFILGKTYLFIGLYQLCRCYQMILFQQVRDSTTFKTLIPVHGKSRRSHKICDSVSLIRTFLRKQN